MRKKKNTTTSKGDDLIKLLKASIKAEQQKKLAAQLQEKTTKDFKPLPGAHANNCELCHAKDVCILANKHFTFCPKQTKRSKAKLVLSNTVMERLFTLRIN